MRLAIFSDIHGNAIALEAVWADLKQRGFDAAVCLGDAIQGGLDVNDVRFAIGQEGAVRMKPMADSAAPNSSFFVSSDHSNKLCWKDSGGTVKVFSLDP